PEPRETHLGQQDAKGQAERDHAETHRHGQPDGMPDAALAVLGLGGMIVSGVVLVRHGVVVLGVVSGCAVVFRRRVRGVARLSAALIGLAPLGTPRASQGSPHSRRRSRTSRAWAYRRRRTRP